MVEEALEVLDANFLDQFDIPHLNERLRELECAVEPNRIISQYYIGHTVLFIAVPLPNI